MGKENNLNNLSVPKVNIKIIWTTYQGVGLNRRRNIVATSPTNRPLFLSVEIHLKGTTLSLYVSQNTHIQRGKYHQDCNQAERVKFMR